MKLFISTPAYNAQLTIPYVKSLQDSLRLATEEGIINGHVIDWLGNESLIPRGRNRAARNFIKSDCDKLLTIDADIEWSYADFKRIITSGKDLVGGIYPLKAFPVVANFNPLPEHTKEFFTTHRGLDIDALLAYAHKYADPLTGEVEVRHVPTGFMCTRREVIDKLSETAKVYGTFQPDTGEIETFFDFYPCGVVGHDYLSEDWQFVENIRAAGFKAYINTKVLLGHCGTHTYRLGQFFGQGEVCYTPGSSCIIDGLNLD